MLICRRLGYMMPLVEKKIWAESLDNPLVPMTIKGCSKKSLRLTVRKKCGDGKAERDDGLGVEQQKDVRDRRVRVVDDRTIRRRDVHQNGDDADGDGQRDGVFEPPREPMKVTLHAHQLHRLLRTHGDGNCF